MTTLPAVEVEALAKRYGGRAAVDDLTFTVPRAAVVAVLGPNGAGKTTTVECCEGYRRPDEGSVRVLGLDPIRDGSKIRPRIGVMLQEGGGLYPGARPEELLAHLARLYAEPLDVPSLVDRLDLGSVRGTAVRRLSGGQRQRLALAAAVVGRPEVAFLDEPTAGLDPHARRATWGLVRELRASGCTVVLTTHLMDEAEELADHVVIIDRGQLVGAGTPAQLTRNGPARILRFDGPPGLDLASLRSALPDDVTLAEVEAGHYRMDGPVDPELLATLTAWCAARGVLTRELNVGRRTLEDVFLELTGRERRP